ncbi:YIP1 family protein [Marinobacter hydrocarbonoclasticus]|nr:YIP1 family protein [Marinobacter nauticus]
MSSAALPQSLWHSLWRPMPVYSDLKNRKGTSWGPFLLIVVSFCLLQWFYFHGVDWSWYQAEILEPMLKDIPSRDRPKVLAEMTANRVLIAQVSMGIIGLLVANALMGFYLSKVTQIDDENVLSFGDWFGLTWWCNLVMVPPMLISLGVLMVADGPSGPGVMAPVSLNRLLDLPVTHGWYNYAEAFSLLLPWKIALYYAGIRAWTRVSANQALLIAALPAVVVYGGWAAFLSF